MNTQNKRHLVIGLGQIGSALVEIFKCDGEDKFQNIEASEKHYVFLHISFPYSDDFISEVKRYQDKYNPKYTIIHSTVPMGTTEKCGANHSPVRGIHPHLKEGILTFKKFIGGEDCFEIASEFKKYRIDCLCVHDSKVTEALKLIDTTQYGYLIMLNKEIYKWCQKYGLNFDIVYSLANETYNDGYTKLFHPQVVRPYLDYRNEPIGGHCVIPNAKLLMKDTPIHCAEWILEENDKLL